MNSIVHFPWTTALPGGYFLTLMKSRVHNILATLDHCFLPALTSEYSVTSLGKKWGKTANFSKSMYISPCP